MHTAIIVAYYTAWSIYSRSFFVDQIPADKITHINYAFANINTDGRLVLGDQWADVDKAFTDDRWDQPLRGNFYQLFKLKQKYPHLRTLISVGGWTWSGRFSDVALNQTSRERFAQSCVEFIEKYHFDGVDIDWEYPVSGGLPGNTQRREDKQNYVLLLKEIREQLDRANSTTGRPYLLTVATGAGTERIGDLDLPGMIKYLNWINIMTYDFHGSWESKTGHNAPLFKNDQEAITDVAPSYFKSRYNCHGAVQGYIAAGAPRSKLVMGLGLYGRGWQEVNGQIQNGFSQPASFQPPTGTWENGVFDYDHLKKSYLPSYKRYWDNSSKVPFLYNSTTRIWITYDDSDSIRVKSDYIKRAKLAGAMFWELSSDREAELVGIPQKILNNNDPPSPESAPPASSELSIGSSAEKVKNDSSTWRKYIDYYMGDRVIYEGNTYECIAAHRSIPELAPSIVVSLWKKI